LDKINNTSKETWEWQILPESSWFNFNLSDLLGYRHLLLRLIRRDFLIHHQQTLLGPLWIAYQPIITLVMYVFIFEKAVGLSTDGLPSYLFYFSGIIIWNLFSDCFAGTAFTFTQNANLFEKVYFPRLIIPLSVIATNLIRFFIQLVLYAILLVYYVLFQNFEVSPIYWVPALFAVMLLVPGLGLGLGLIFSLLTAKYRDLVNVIHLGVRLLMFATPVIYPLSLINTTMQKWVLVNPLTPVFEYFRFAFLGSGTFTLSQLIYSFITMVVLVIFGSMLFNRYGSKLQDVL
jgi:lipopolysaccharide transport system permease protein